MRHVNPAIAALAERAGIVFPGAVDFLPRERYTADRRGPNGETSGYGEIIMDGALAAMDAEPTLITSPNAGVPSLYTTYIDPKLIEVLLTPNNAVKIYGETRKGDWLDETIGFMMVESTGEVTSYGDFNDGGGRAGANVQWEWRQPYLFQSFTEWGDRETERMGRARVDWVSRLNISTAINHDKFYNNSAFYGIAGLANYGALNDPSLSAALTPSTKAATGTSWQKALAQEILADVQAMFAQAQIQTGSNLEMDTRMTLALHSVSEVYLANTNAYGLVSAMDLIKKTFPNLRVQQAPQFLSGTTYSCQLIIDEIEGQKTIEIGFNEKMRAHRVIYDTSSVRQKKTGGTEGALLYRPIGIVTMSGI
jgi:hypothetical protein